MQCFVGDESILVWDRGGGGNDLRRMIGVGQKVEGILLCRSDGTMIMQWRTISRMLKKEEMCAVVLEDGHKQVHLDSWQPFFKFVNTNGSRLVRCILVDHGYLETVPDSLLFDLLWTGKHIKKSLLQGFGPYQKINHFPRTYEITRKDRLYKNVHAMFKLHNDPNFDFLPKTYVLPEEHLQLQKRLRKADERWILKPNSSSRGRGIFIIRDLLDVSAAALERCVVCRYIDNPLLINGFKFDLRIYVAVTSFFPLRVWIYEEGLARFATEYYRDDGYKNPFIHLTNYSINKKSKKFSLRNPDGKDDDVQEAVGSKWRLSVFRRFLRDSGIDDAEVFSRIESCVAHALVSVEGCCAPATQDWAKYRGSCFELFGFDVLLDDKLKPWVLEVNLSPSLSVESTLDFSVKSRLLSDLLNLVGCEVFDRRNPRETSPPPFQDTYSASDVDQMVEETKGELARSGGWKMLVPAVDARFDRFFPEQRRQAYVEMRKKMDSMQ